MVAAVIGARDMVSGLQPGSKMTLGGLFELGVATACTVVVIIAAWYVFANGRKGLQRLGGLIDTVPGQAAAGVLLVATGIGGCTYLIGESRWLELIFPAATAVIGLSALRNAARRRRKGLESAGIGPDIEKLP
jgi:hypothetical protein